MTLVCVKLPKTKEYTKERRVSYGLDKDMGLLGGVFTAQEEGGEGEGPKEQKSELAWWGQFLQYSLFPIRTSQGWKRPSTSQRGLKCWWKTSLSYGVGPNPTKNHLYK